MDNNLKLLTKELQESQRVTDSLRRNVAQITAQNEGTTEQLTKTKADHKVEVEMLHDQISSLIETQRKIENERAAEREEYIKKLSVTQLEHSDLMQTQAEIERKKFKDQLEEKQTECEEQLRRERLRSAELEDKLRNATEQINQLTSKIAKKEAQTIDLESRVASAEKMLSVSSRGTATETRVLLERLKSLENQKKEESEKHKAEIDEKERTVRDLNQRLKAEEQEKSRFADTSRRNEIEIEKLMTDLRRVQAANEEMGKTMKQIEAEKEAERETTQRGMFERTEMITREADELRRTLTEHEYKARENENARATLEATLQQTKRDAEIERKVLQSELINLRQRLDETTREKNAIAKELELLAGERDQMAARLNELEAAIDSIGEKESSLNQDLYEVKRLKEELSNTHRQIKSEKQHEEMEEEIRMLRENIATMEQKLGEEIAARDGKNLALNEEVRQLRGRVGVLEAQLKDAEDEVAQNEADLRRLRTENAKLREGKRLIEDEAGISNQELNNLRATNEMLRNNLELTKRQLDEIKAKTDRGSDQMSAEIRHLTSKLNDATALSESRAKRLAELEQLFDQANQRTKLLLNEQTKAKTRTLIAEDPYSGTATLVNAPTSALHTLHSAAYPQSSFTSTLTGDRASGTGLMNTPTITPLTSAKRVTLVPPPSALHSTSTRLAASSMSPSFMHSALSNPTTPNSVPRLISEEPFITSRRLASSSSSSISSSVSPSTSFTPSKGGLIESSTLTSTPTVRPTQLESQRKLNELLQRKRQMTPPSNLFEAKQTEQSEQKENSASNETLPNAMAEEKKQREIKNENKNTDEQLGFNAESTLQFPDIGPTHSSFESAPPSSSSSSASSSSSVQQSVNPPLQTTDAYQSNTTSPSSSSSASASASASSNSEPSTSSSSSLPANSDSTDENTAVRKLFTGVFLKSDPTTLSGTDLQAELNMLRSTMNQAMKGSGL
ncbi:uncharacterized protein MONOS_9420 [Monocercomonoides exilis]|uniref:uncharacterized protein n=1 Tax=Monocercomonoides exilis TaxID=2049356 RepID=UPI0035598731|nr:hypothetical protein MONOS_9420 [Monocercomonoides exilis]|eukprot:MONOS_9420.1-p1 / transcript=MONOS_9420.1 / gene=MONOS_9420 / organism=Monocercomonoides_exilis_PA203 / gene_product=unspecified product / transcript_product=unspecified product / location=Mono_scaffold00388:52355-55752(-) / protein_length=964 / sequence_SO=supercontig / SO=protein_coding / is_pseudo=false